MDVYIYSVNANSQAGNMRRNIFLTKTEHKLQINEVSFIN